MFLIARGPRHWQAGKVPTAKHRRERQIRAVKSRFRRRHGGMNTTQESKVASSIFIGRWTPMVLFSLEERPYRHGQLRPRLGSVSQRMLTLTLRNLESAGLIARRVTITGGVSVLGATAGGVAIVRDRKIATRMSKIWKLRTREPLPSDLVFRGLKTNVEYEHKGENKMATSKERDKEHGKAHLARK